MLEDNSLKIYNITKTDAGVYTCIAMNQFGVARNSGTLIVKGILLSSFVLYEYWKCTYIFDETYWDVKDHNNTVMMQGFN